MAMAKSFCESETNQAQNTNHLQILEERHDQDDQEDDPRHVSFGMNDSFDEGAWVENFPSGDSLIRLAMRCKLH